MFWGTVLPRLDIHRPSLIEPADYEFLTDFYQGANADLMRDYAYENRSHREFQEASPLFDGNWSTKGSCDHCGASFSYGVCYRHLPTGELINVGHICAAGTLSFPSRVEMKRKEAAERGRVLRMVEEFTEENEAVVFHLQEFKAENSFYSDLWMKLHKYGELSERQVAAVERNIDADIERRAKWEAEKANAVPVPTGRMQICGEVKTTKVQESDFGDQVKMLVLDDRGFKVWGTVPNSIYNVSKGERVSFMAQVAPTEKDAYFGIFKRPTQAKLIS